MTYLKKLDMNQSFAFWHLMSVTSPFDLFEREYLQYKRFWGTPNPPSINPLIHLIYYISHDRSNLYGLRWLAQQRRELVIAFLWHSRTDFFSKSRQKAKPNIIGASKGLKLFKSRIISDGLKDLISNTLLIEFLQKIEAQCKN